MSDHSRALGISTQLRPYLPRVQLEWLASNDRETHRVIDGSLVFADISGFTRLSEMLAKRHGRAGAEEVVDVIGGCFEHLLPLAYDEGGGLVKFGGDALLLLFTDADHPARASRAAGAMQAAMRRIGSVRAGDLKARLRMSAGVHSGALHFFLVGGAHRELLVTGPGATATAAMEAAAEAGEVLVSDATAASLPPAMLAGRKGEGVLLAPSRGRRAPSGPPPRPPRVSEEKLLACVPTSIRRHVLSGMREAEHRLVTLAFVKFAGVDGLLERDGVVATAAHLDAFISHVQAATERHEVTFLATDVDRDGGKVLLAAGAPQATTDDEARMLGALHEIISYRGPLKVRAGANCGHVLVGDVGPHYRRTYTAMGDATNLAARVMAHADAGQVLATRAVVERSTTAFDTTPVTPFMVKGKSEPVVADEIGPPRPVPTGAHDTRPRTPFVGREYELGVLASALDGARNGRGGVVDITGEPGIGKSRLVEELCRRATGDGIRLIQVACDRYESSTPYHPFRTILREAFRGGSVPDVVARRAPELLPWLPLLAIPLDVSVEPTVESEQLDERFRRTRLELAVGDLLTRLLDEPTLVVVEDAHWIDEASADLLAHLATRTPARPWLVCITRRDVVGAPAPTTGGHVQRLHPGPLTAGDAATLIETATADAPFSPHDVAALAARAAGNPLFVEELVAAARTAGGLDGLPDTVESLMAVRIDRLAPDVRQFLRRLSVLGTSFPVGLAHAVDPDRCLDEAAWESVDEFVARDDGTVRFRHGLLRETAYQALPFRLRRDLHAAVGDRIAAEAADDAERVAEVLSFHFHHAQRHADAWRHSVVAGESARAVYANADAATFYERALDAARRLPLTPLELAPVHEALGVVRARLGDYHGADRAYRAARRSRREDAVADARLTLQIAWLRGYLERYADARRWVSRGLRRLDGECTAEADVQRAELLACQARFAQEAGQLRSAIRWCERAISAADAAGADRATAEAEKVLGWAHLYNGRGAEAVPHLDRALRHFELVGDLSGQASVLNMMGAAAYWRGEWTLALDLYDRARDLVGRTGNAVMQAFCTNNIGEILCDQGRLAEAEQLFRQATRVWQAAGHRSRVAYAKTNLARVALRSERYGDALRLYEEARAESLDVGADGDVLESDARIAECLLLEGRWATALAHAESGLDHLRSVGGSPPQTALLQRVRGAALLRLGDVVRARESLEASLAAGRVRHADYEIALTLQVMADLSEQERGTRDVDLDAESRAILARLGVVS